MSAEPEDDDVSGQPLSASEWASWVLLGNPYGRIPIPLKELALRIALAIEKAVEENRY